MGACGLTVPASAVRRAAGPLGRRPDDRAAGGTRAASPLPFPRPTGSGLVLRLLRPAAHRAHPLDPLGRHPHGERQEEVATGLGATVRKARAAAAAERAPDGPSGTDLARDH
jgi:hypothetical protein